ncbi:AraC family transcriptional regulator [Caulobacter mirabilis]|uniref:AraC family transcriptional regulator n=1 Tax=Caulobacter mirabilis TaxID=69666 RepID=A0A2D2AXM9_9CAUL|nr:AraC family transcriptional regulator [Caulobacter mirabilis]ATQ42731.1 AraC family transcriptional regulator [Caulobacter mirabilis]
MTAETRNLTQTITPTAPTVSAGYGRALFDYAVSRGASAEALTAGAGLAAEDLADQDGRLPLDRFLALIRTAKALCDAPALVLEFCAASRFEAFSLVGLICQAAETMGEGLRQLNRYQRLVTEAGGDGERFKLARQGADLWLVDQRPDPASFPELTELAFGRFVCEVARHFGEDISFVKAIEVAHARPPHAEAYDRILRAPTRFGIGRNAMRIDEAWLAMRTHAPNRYVFGIFNDRADALLERLGRERTVRGRVEALLAPRLHMGEAAMAEIAVRLGMSRQTLYRRLKAEGTGFDAIVDDLRCALADGYLDSERLSVNETAYLLGFSDPSAFSRAYKRWTGASPTARKDR